MREYPEYSPVKGTSTSIIALLCMSFLYTPALAQPGLERQESADIIVTGSRISRDGFQAPTPVTAIGADRLEAVSASNVGDVMSSLPSFRASASPSATQVNPGTTVGSRILELRGLGSARTLVLVNGRRFVPTTSQGTVDTNFIPGILIDQVDVVTGGASAAYGSDAVAGVVNFVLNNKLEGFKAEAQAGISEQGDDRTTYFGLAGGTRFGGGRGRIIIGGEYEDNKGMGDCYQSRSICAEEWVLLGNSPPGTGGAPALTIAKDVHTGNISPGGLITTGPMRGIEFGPDGTPQQYVFGRQPGLFMQGGSGHGRNAFLSGLLMKVPVERWNSHANISYDLSDNLNARVELSYGEVRASMVTAQLRDTGSIMGAIQRDNAYLHPTMAALMDSNNISQFTFGRAGMDLGNAHGSSKSTVFRAVTALEGKLGENFRWDAYYQYGRSTYHQNMGNNIIRSRLKLATDAIDDPRTAAFDPICRSTLTDPTNGCVPINLMGENLYTPQAHAYIMGRSELDLKVTQQVAALNIQGEPFSLWAGPVSFAAGYEYRQDKINGTTDPLSPTGAFYVSNFAASNGRVTVHEAYLETILPLLKDSAVGDFELNGAVRRTDYSTSGAITTWKVGGVWEPADFLRLRGTKSRDIRAPNINELFGSVSRSFSSYTDPLNGQQGLIEILGGANDELKPEKADTWTVGLVLTPSRIISGFNFSADYYDINVDDAIGQVGAQTIGNRCLSGATEFCPLITRDSNGQVTMVNDRLRNVNSMKTRGLDLEASWKTVLGEDNRVDVRMLATKVFELTTVDSAGNTNRAGQTGFRASSTPGVPDWIVDGLVQYGTGPLTLSLHGRYIPKGKFNVDFVGPEDAGYDPAKANSISTNRVAGRFYASLGLNWEMKTDRGAFDFFINVRNLFDKDPPVAPSAVGMTNQVLFDQIGRSWRVGVRVRQ